MSHWVISAGDGSRDYSKYFLDYGIAFLGGEGQIETLTKVAVGDILLLKRRTSQILAAGSVISPPCTDPTQAPGWLRDFDGWDLPAYCHVEWHPATRPVSSPELKLRQGTIYGAGEHLYSTAAELLEGPKAETRPHPPDPVVLDDEDLVRELVKEGLRPAAAEEFTDALRRIRLLADYYYHNVHWEQVREHETRSFLVLPLLLALGWTEQQLKIEYPAAGGRIDIACFRRPFGKGSDDLGLVIETKGFNKGLDFAAPQAQKYATAFTPPPTLLVTNGIAYRMLETDPGAPGELRLTGYLNLRSPHRRYPLDSSIPGAVAVLTSLLPRRA